MSLKRRNILTLKEKMAVIGAFEYEKLSARELAKRFQIGKTQAAIIIKNREAIKAKVCSDASEVNLGQKRNFCKSGGALVDRTCHEWFCSLQEKAVPLTPGLVKAKAKEVAADLGYVGFRASDGWLHRFKLRHNIRFGSLGGEASHEQHFKMQFDIPKDEQEADGHGAQSPTSDAAFDPPLVVKEEFDLDESRTRGPAHDLSYPAPAVQEDNLQKGYSNYDKEVYNNDTSLASDSVFDPLLVLKEEQPDPCIDSPSEFWEEDTKEPHQGNGRDECDIYGELVATRLRKMKEHKRQLAMRKIDDLIFEMTYC